MNDINDSVLRSREKIKKIFYEHNLFHGIYKK